MAAIKGVYKPKKGEENLISRVETFFNVANEAMRNTHRVWRESEELYHGKHWQQPGMPSNQNQITMDLIASAIDTMIPILASRPPKIDVLPASTSDEDTEVANVMQQQLDDLWELRDMMNLIPEWLSDFLVYGNGIMKVHFGDDDLPDCDIVDPFSFYVNPMATRMEDAQWVIYAAPALITDIKKKYPNGKYVEAQGNLNLYEAMKPHTDFDGKTSIPNPDGSVTRYENKQRAMEELEERALLIECWWRDGETEYEDGDGVKKVPGVRMTTIANGVLLHDGPTPYPFLNKDNYIQNPFPFIVAKNGGTAHTFWGRPEPKRLKTINLSMDKIASQVMDNINLMANPMWVVDETAGVKNQIVNRPGGIITKTGPGQVEMKQPASIPNYVFNFFQLMETMFEIVSGVNKATQGREAPNVTSGVQAEVYRRSATTKIDFKSRTIDSAVQQLGAMWLAFIQNLGENEHQVTVPNELGEQQYTYTGLELQGKPMRVRAKAGSMMPDNKAFIEEKILQLVQLGIIQDTEFVIENIELPGKQKLLNKIRAEKRVQMEAEMQVQQEDDAAKGVLDNSTDEDEIMSVLKQRPELMEQYQ